MAFSGTFWKILTKKRVVGGVHYPSKSLEIEAQCAFRKFLGPVTKNGYLKIVGGPQTIGGSQNRGAMERSFGSAGVESQRGGGRIPEGGGGESQRGEANPRGWVGRIPQGEF